MSIYKFLAVLVPIMSYMCMRCIICNTEAVPYFAKTYQAPYEDMMRDIGTVHYEHCRNCGFTFSRTHRELPLTAWQKLNYHFHNYLEDLSLAERLTNQPPYAEQALMIALLGKHRIIDTSDILDYAGGRGALSGILKRYMHLTLPIYDPYITNVNPEAYVQEKDLRTYKTVINSAMFEHVLERENLDKVHACVAEDGVLIIHTVVGETVPCDPDWFYLGPPVHTAFHTNRSMQLLMEQWGYKASIYSPKSKCWVLLRTHQPQIAQKINAINQELQCAWFYYKQGFMDYWK